MSLFATKIWKKVKTSLFVSSLQSRKYNTEFQDIFVKMGENIKKIMSDKLIFHPGIFSLCFAAGQCDVMQTNLEIFVLTKSKTGRFMFECFILRFTTSYDPCIVWNPGNYEEEHSLGQHFSSIFLL